MSFQNPIGFFQAQRTVCVTWNHFYISPPGHEKNLWAALSWISPWPFRLQGGTGVTFSCADSVTWLEWYLQKTTKQFRCKSQKSHKICGVSFIFSWKSLYFFALAMAGMMGSGMMPRGTATGVRNPAVFWGWVWGWKWRDLGEKNGGFQWICPTEIWKTLILLQTGQDTVKIVNRGDVNLWWKGDSSVGNLRGFSTRLALLHKILQNSRSKNCLSRVGSKLGFSNSEAQDILVKME